MALWGQAANITQLLGVDLFGLITMIEKAARTVCRNEEACRQISDRASMIRDRLQQLQQVSRFFEHPEMWKPTQGLKATLGRAYRLIIDCQHSSYAYKFCWGSDIADELESALKDMDAWNQHLTNVKVDILFNAFTIIVTRELHGNRNTIKQAWDLCLAGGLLEFIDPMLHGEPQNAEIIRWVQIALLCVQEDPEERPSMSDVLLMLSSENNIQKQPKRPAYY